MKLVLFILIAIAILSITAYASTVSVQSTTKQAQYGVSFTITNTFTIQDSGFSVSGASTGASSLPCSWANGGQCNQALTINHYRDTLKLIIKTSPSSTTTYTVTPKWDQGSGQTIIGGSSLTVSVPTTASVGQSMNFVFDTGSTTFTQPQSMDVTIQ